MGIFFHDEISSSMRLSEKDIIFKLCLWKVLFVNKSFTASNTPPAVRVIEYVQIKMFVYELDCEAKTLLIYLYDCSFIDSISGVTSL